MHAIPLDLNKNCKKTLLSITIYKAYHTIRLKSQTKYLSEILDQQEEKIKTTQRKTMQLDMQIYHMHTDRST